MKTQTLTPQQLDDISQIESPLVRERVALYYQLPKDLRETMISEETSSKVWNIVKTKNGLPDESVSGVARVIGLVMLGVIKVSDFIEELSKALNIDIQKASLLAGDINEQIFQPVRESLLLVHDLKSEDVVNKNKTPEPKPIPEEEPKPVIVEPEIETENKEDVAKKRKEDLINKLKENEEDSTQATMTSQPTKKGVWNGRTIDLSKIPPRREKPRD